MSDSPNTPARVRFSQDLERPAASALRPGGLNLSINTSTIAHGSTEPGRVSSDAQARSPTGISPSSISPRTTRERGLSLRRSLFHRGLNTQTQNNDIELAEQGPFSPGISVNLSEPAAEGVGKKQATSSISPIVREETASPSSDSDSDALGYKSQNSSGVFYLPKHNASGQAVLPRTGFVKKTAAQVKRVYEDVFGKQELPPTADGRHLPLDATRRTPLIDERTAKPYIGNSIRSSRYTLWNFVPRQLFFQFSKLANFYFLLVSVLQMIPGLSTTGTYTTIIPLMIFVSISMAKEGYDDYRRYKLDKIENNNEVLVLHVFQPMVVEQDPELSVRQVISNWARSKKTPNSRAVDENEARVPMSEPVHWASLKWRDVAVGDIVKLQRNDAVPADILLLHADGPNGIAFIETMALDGETNMKTKQPPTPLAKQCSTLDGLVDCRAQIVVEDPNLDLYNFHGRATIGSETLPLTTNEVVFRGSILRNTQTAIGMVINTGEECKIRQNANKNPRIKAPEMQAITNRIVIMLVIFVILLALFCTAGYQIWAKRVEDVSWYLNDAHIPFSFISIGFIILYNTLIPLSLYVSLEIIKVGQLLLMNDVEMYDPVSNTPMISNTSTILENLGQIDFVFSDKTGTLTDNVMRFRKLSVAGYAWLHDWDLLKEAAEQRDRDSVLDERQDRGWKGKGRMKQASTRARSQAPATDAAGRLSSASLWKSSARPAKAQPELSTRELLRYIEQKPHSMFTKKAKFFILSIALCHTCLPELQENGAVEFQAASPDELALVQAAQELGYLVIDRPARSITLRSGNPQEGDGNDVLHERYEILDVIEFSSKRKRMSIIVRFPDGRICIFCKGADSFILPRLKLAAVALQKKSEITRKASVRKSMEADQALREMSMGSARNSINRPSLSGTRRSLGIGGSKISGGLLPIRDELDTWLSSQGRHVEAASDDTGAIQSSAATPRPSMGRYSLAGTARTSMQAERFDDLVDDALVLDDAAVFERCFQHIDDFASEGLRTLLFGYRFLEEGEYSDWKRKYTEATTSLVDRQKRIESVGELIEQNFDLAGATAIEDKLQIGVPETIDKLRRAKIKVWMLTGDKRETAINIAHSARICKTYSEVIILDRETNEVQVRMENAIFDINQGRTAHSVVVVDGGTLAEIDASPTLSQLFFDLAVVADSVICCRASPSQKASLVKTIRKKVKHAVTLAIGDGANDIAMIQEAHVGIGISGKEGLQAARIADYSIAQFRFLQKLLFVHGHWNYVRTGKYILGTFWKELLFYGVQAFYQKWNGYTGTSLFESTSLTVFNTLFTSLPVLFIGIFEQDLAASTLLAVPELYSYGQHNQGFNLHKYFGWMFMAASEAVLIYFLACALFGASTVSRDNTLYSLGDLCFTASVIVIVTKMLVLEMHAKTYISLAGWVLSIGGWFVWNLLLSAIYPAKSSRTYAVHDGFIDQFGRDALWWLTLIIILIAIVVLELGVGSLRKAFWPSRIEEFQELQKESVWKRRFEQAAAGLEDSGVDAEGREMEMTQEQQQEKEQETREREVEDLLRERARQEEEEEGKMKKRPARSSVAEVVDAGLARKTSLRQRGRKGNGNSGSAVEMKPLSPGLRLGSGTKTDRRSRSVGP